MVREILLFLSVSDLFVAHRTALMLCPCLNLREDRVIAMDQLPDKLRAARQAAGLDASAA